VLVNHCDSLSLKKHKKKQTNIFYTYSQSKYYIWWCCWVSL